jgi:hypothetical protein
MKVKCECSALNAVNTSQKREHAVARSEDHFLYHGNGQQVIILIRSKRTLHFVNAVKLYRKAAELIVTGPSELCN